MKPLTSNLYDKIQTTLAYQNFQESRYDRDFQSEIENIREEAVILIEDFLKEDLLIIII